MFNPHFVFVNNLDNFDVAVIDAAYQANLHGHSFGPVSRDRHILHYITHGGGELKINDKSYTLKAGDLFYVPPTTTFYKAKKDNPYSYYFVGLRGDKVQGMLSAAGITETSPVKHLSDDKVPEFMQTILDECSAKTTASLIRAHGNIMHLLSYLCALLPENNVPIKPVNTDYIPATLHYIETNYSKDISVQSIADHLYIHRSYLSTLFHEAMNITVSQYLINFRIKKACEFLSSTGYSITSISYLTGFNNPYNFSKRFSAHKNMSPKEYRHQHKTEPEQ